MNPQLRNMVVVAGLVAMAGIGFTVLTPVPATRTMDELRDAGLADPAGQNVVLVCPERLTKQTKNRLKTYQSGVLRPSQSYAHIARVAVCWPDGGAAACIRTDGGLPPTLSDAEVVVSSLRIDLDAGATSDDGGENAVDDSLLFDMSACHFEHCQLFDGGSPSPFPNAFCGNRNRVAVVPSPCMLPNCWTLGDGGWDDNATVDCLAGGPYALPDGGPRWRGCNVLPADYASGTACLPVECSVVSGDNPIEWL